MSERARALEQALRAIRATLQGVSPNRAVNAAAEAWSIACATLAVDPPPSGASPRSVPCHCGGVMFGDGNAHTKECPCFEGASPQAEVAPSRKRCSYCWDAHDCPVCRAACIDCGLPYSNFPVDVLLPRSQWLEIHPDENGLLCAACIVRRASLVPGCASVHAFIEIVPQARPGAADQPSTSASPALSTVDVSHGQRPTIDATPASPQAETSDPIEEAAERIYRRYGNDLAAFQRDYTRELRSAPVSPVEPTPEPPQDGGNPK